MTPQLIDGDEAALQIISCRDGMTEQPRHRGHFIIRNEETLIYGWITPDYIWEVDVARTMYELGYHKAQEEIREKLPEGAEILPITPEMAQKVKAMMSGQMPTPQRTEESPEYTPGGYL